MKILRLTAEGFGGFSGELELDPTRLNLIVGNNESGKTTFAAAVAAGLYGLDRDGRHYPKRLSPHQQYEPWAGASYAIELVFENKGRRYTVTRHFGRGVVTVFEHSLGNVSEEFRLGTEYVIGEQILGLNVDQFVRSALWLQDGPARFTGEDVRPDGSISTLLERQASTVSGDLSAQDALAVLEGALRRYEHGEKRRTVNNQIREFESELEERRGRLAHETERTERGALALGELGRARTEEAALELSRRRTAQDVMRQAVLEIEGQLARDDEGRSAVARLREELGPLLAVEVVPANAADGLLRAEAERKAAERTLEELANRREQQVERPRAEIQKALAEARGFEWAAPVHIDEVAALEREFARLLDARTRAKTRRGEVETDLRRAGVHIERLETLRARFSDLSEVETNLLTHAPAAMQAWATENEKAQHAAEEAADVLAAIGRERALGRALGFVLLAVGVAAATSAVWIALAGRVAWSLVGLGATLAAFAGGTWLVLRSTTRRASERQASLRALSNGRRRMQELRGQAAERTLQLDELAARLGFASSPELLGDHADHLRVMREGDRLSWISGDLARLEAEQRALEGRAREWAKRAGLPDAEKATADGWDAAEALGRVREGLWRVIAERAKLERLLGIDRDLGEQMAAGNARRDRARDAAHAVVRALGTPEDDWERALEEIEARRRAQERRRHLEGTLPDVERHILPDTDRAARAVELERLRADLKRAEREDPEWAAIRPPAPPPRGEVEARAREVESRLEAVRRRRVELEREVGWLEDAHRASRGTELRLSIAELERDLERAKRFQQAVRVASERLQNVARETNARWSEFLARRVNDLLRGLGPGYGGFQVTDDLDYSLLLDGQRVERERIDQVLSAGARDQLRLAIRLSICEFLSRGTDPLPIVLDDPFATSDDGRAAAGLRFLADSVAPEHQVIVLTCHQGRIEEFRRRDPQWFADRVQVVEMAAAKAKPGRLSDALPAVMEPARAPARAGTNGGSTIS